MTDITVREAEPSDGAVFRAHMLSIYLESSVDTPISMDEYTLTATQESERIRTYQEADNALFLVAVLPSTQIIGSLRLRGGKLRSTRHRAEIALYINSGYRQQGLGQRLLHQAIDWARQNPIITRVELEVYTRNQIALHVYQKQGFEVEGRRRRFTYQDSSYQDSYLMGLLL